MGLFKKKEVALIDENNEWVKKIMDIYRYVWNNKEALGVNSVGIHNNFFEMDGRFADYSKFLAVEISSSDGVNIEAAQTVGFIPSIIQGKLYIQYPFKHDFKSYEKKQIIECVKTIIEKEFPNDYIQCDMSVPFLVSGLDIKDIVEIVNNNR